MGVSSGKRKPIMELEKDTDNLTDQLANERNETRRDDIISSIRDTKEKLKNEYAGVWESLDRIVSINKELKIRR